MSILYNSEESIDFNVLEQYIMKYINKNKNKGNMLAISGMWGGGKTYFWQTRIEKELENEDDIDKYVYISLYGVDSIKRIEQILSSKVQKLLDSAKEKLKKKLGNETSDRLELITQYGLKIGADLGKKYFGVDTEEYKNIAMQDMAKEILCNDNILICFDDLERKSSKLPLNDFFGYVNNLSEMYKLTIVIIYNENYLKDDKNIYEETKEKLISKYIAFNPKIEELFELILQKYKNIENYTFVKNELQDIFVIEIFEKLNLVNARTYEKILNNIFEWLEKYPDLNNIDIMKSIALSTISFTHYNTSLEFIKNKRIRKDEEVPIKIERYFLFLQTNYSKNNIVDFHNMCVKYQEKNISIEKFISTCKHDCQDIEKHTKSLQAIYLFGYCLKYGKNIEEEINNNINKFIKTGIL